MSGTEFPVSGTECGDANINEAALVAPTRFYGLDGVRATAMLLGVFYHLPISIMAGGFGMGFDFSGSPKSSIDNWLHSFRMPLFFLISGFFANMMLGKYGLKRYMVRRWWRIGAPLFIAIAAFAGLRMATDYFRSAAVPGFGPPGAMNAGFGVPARRRSADHLEDSACPARRRSVDHLEDSACPARRRSVDHLEGSACPARRRSADDLEGSARPGRHRWVGSRDRR